MTNDKKAYVAKVNYQRAVNGIQQTSKDYDNRLFILHFALLLINIFYFTRITFAIPIALSFVSIGLHIYRHHYCYTKSFNSIYRHIQYYLYGSDRENLSIDKNKSLDESLQTDKQERNTIQELLKYELCFLGYGWIAVVVNIIITH